MSESVIAICRPARLPSTRKCVLMSLADLATDAGVIDAPIASVCDWTCFSRTAVIDALSGLEDAGLLARGKDQGRSSKYEIRLEMVAAMVTDRYANRTGTRTAAGRVQGEPVRQPDGCGDAHPSASRTGGDATGTPAGWVSEPDPSANRTSTRPPVARVGANPSAKRTGVVRQPDALPPDPSASRTGSPQLRALGIPSSPPTTTSEKKELPFCSELELRHTTQQLAAVVEIPLVDGSQFPVTQVDVAEWAAAFPGIDVVGALRRARICCIDNPKKRKTKTGARKFLSGWLGRDQDKAGAPAGKARGHANASQHKGFEEREYGEIGNL